MSEKTLKAQVLEIIVEARQQHQTFIRGLTESERNAFGTPEQWAPRDMLSHTTFWLGNQAIRLAAIARGEKPPRFEDFQKLNEENFEAKRNWTWQQIEAEIDRAFGELTRLVSGFSDDDLGNGNRWEWQEGRPLWRNIVSNATLHPVAHFTEVLVKRGDLADAEKMQQQVVDRMRAMDNGSWYGTAIYNMACFYALAGLASRAIPLLAESLKLQPDLTEWSKEDSDLNSLREMPEYKALYTVPVQS